MKKYIPSIIQVIALAMLIFGIFFCIMCFVNAGKASRGYYTRDPVAEALWNFGGVQCVLVVVSSAFVLGFSYIVEAACRYLERCDIQDIQEMQNSQDSEETVAE